MKFCKLIKPLRKSVTLFFVLISAIGYGQKLEQQVQSSIKGETKSVQILNQPTFPFQNPDMPLEERVNNIVSLMTLDEKIAFLSSNPGIERL